jgi:hypothetical protein
MVLRQVVGIKAGLVQPFNLDKPVSVDLFESQTWNRFNVIENTELQGHSVPPDRHYNIVTASQYVAGAEEGLQSIS